MQVIQTEVKSLRSPTATQDEKLHSYSVVRDSLVTLRDQKVTIDDDDNIGSLVKCANSDITSDNPCMQRAVLLALDSLFQCKFKKFPIDDILESYIAIAFEDAVAGRKDLQETAAHCIQLCVRELIIQNKLDPEKLLMKAIDASSRMQISELMRTACREVPIQKASIFFYGKMVPQMFSTCSIDVRSSLVEDVFELLPDFPLTVLSNEKLEVFKGHVKVRYVERVIELRVLKDPNWHRLWIFLLRCCGKILHVQVDIMNSLLKAVETAFRSSIIEDRLVAYDCWKELIDNYYLDPERMCNPKQMKLIVTPLKTSISKNDLVTYRRFEIWAHLINTLQQRAFICVEPFLEFCFGPLGENPCIAGENPDIRNAGRKVSRLWQETTRALMEIIGHYGHDAEHACMDCTDCKMIRLEQPLINSKNFKCLDYKVINSAGECSLLMLQWMEKSAIKKVMQCLWGSLLNIIKQLHGKEQEKSTERLTLQLVVYIQKCKEKPEYFEYILKPVLDLVLLKQFFPIEVYNKMFLFPLIKSFLKHSDVPFTSGRQIVLDLVSYGKNTNSKSSWFRQAYNVFEKVEVRENLSNLVQFWIECADVLIHMCLNKNEVIAVIVQSTGVQFMMWPIPYMQRIPSKEIMELIDKWGITFEQMYKSFPKETLHILINLRTSIIEAPSTVTSVAMVFPSFYSLLHADPDDKFITLLLHLTSDSLALTNLTKDDADSFVPIITTLMDIISQKTSSPTKDVMLQNLFHCCKCLLQPHEKFKIFEPLDRFFNKMPPTSRESIPEFLLTVITDCKTHSDTTVAAKATKLLNKLTNTPEEPAKLYKPPKLLPPSRAAKISFMARGNLLKESGNSKEPTIRLFGQNLDASSMSPTSARGSQIANASIVKPQKRKAANAFASSNKRPAIDDGDEANYVLINTKYEFKREKLSDHQLEVLKKRKADIPALYQDLSQSQSSSQDLFQSDSKQDFQSGATVAKQEETDSQQNTFQYSEHSYTKPRENDNACSEDASNHTVSNIATNKNIRARKPKQSIHIIDDITIVPPTPTIGTVPVNSVCTPITSQSNVDVQKKPAKDSEGKENTDIEQSDNLLLATEKASTKSLLNTPENELGEVKDASSKVSFFKNPWINDNFDAKANLLLQNPNKEQIDCSSEHEKISTDDEKRSENVAEQHNSPVEKDLRRLSKVQKELNKIKMDIVGGDAFIQNLNLSESKIQTRGRTDLPNSARGLRLRSLSKNNHDGDDSNQRTKLTDRRTLSPRNSKLRELPSSPGKSKLNNGDVKSPTRCKLVDRFNDLQQTEDLGSNQIAPKRGPGRRKSIESHSEKKRSVRKCLNDVLETPPTTIVEANQPKVKEKEVKPKISNNVIVKESEINANTQENANRKSKRRRKTKKLDYTNTDVVEEKNSTNENIVSQNSEDVIESSQESYIEINPRQNCSKLDDSTTAKKKTELADTHNTNLSQLNSEIKQIVTKISQRKIQKPKDNFSFCDPTLASPQKESCNNNNSEATESQSKENVENFLGVCSPDELMRIDLTSRIADLSAGEKDTCEMDTQTQEMTVPVKDTVTTPTKTVSAIPTSPVGVDTPTRTYELISNTLDISPIKQDNKSQSQRTQDLFDSEASTPKSDPQPAEEPESKSTNDKQTPEVTSASKTLPSIANPSTRSAKLLNLVSCTPTLKRTKLLLTKVNRVRPNILIQPKGHRTMQMMQKCEQSVEPQDVSKEQTLEVVHIEDSDEESKGCIPEKDLLQFIRVLPEPTASPKYSILKRRRTPDMNDEGLSPPRKQKRVNFSDPPLTCQKVFIQDENEHIRYPPAKKIKEVKPLPGYLRINFPSFDIASNSEDVPMDQDNKQEVPAITPPEASGSEADTEFHSVPTQGSVDTTEAHLLNRDQPIYLELVDCKENIQSILPALTSHIYVATLLEECHSKKLDTIGDLAKLSEIEVNRLPVKIPKVASVRIALEKFHKSQKLRSTLPINVNVEHSTEIDKDNSSNDLKLQENMPSQSSQGVVNEVSNTEQKPNKVEINHNQPNGSSSSTVTSNGTDVKLSDPISLPIALKSSQNGVKSEELPKMPRKKLIRKIPLRPVTSTHSTSPFRFKEVQVGNSQTPISLPFKAKTSPSNTNEERKKLQGVMSDLIADFKNLQNKAIQQDLKTSSLYETIIEIVGPDVFVSILQENQSLCLTHFVRNNDWSTLFREVLDSIGIKKFMFWLTRVPKVSPLNIVDGIFEQLAAKDANIKNIAIHIMETVPLTLILNQFGMQRIVTELHQLCQNSSFSTSEFLDFMMSKFSPSIEDIIPTFHHINIVQLEGKTVQRTNSFEKDLSSFIERILTTVEKSRLPAVFPKDKMLPLYDSKELTTGIIQCSSNEEILESCETLLQKLPKANLKEGTYKSLAQCMFTKIPYGDLWQYFCDHVNNCPDVLHSSN